MDSASDDEYPGSHTDTDSVSSEESDDLIDRNGGKMRQHAMVFELICDTVDGFPTETPERRCHYIGYMMHAIF